MVRLEKICSLARNVGRPEICPQSAACAFWELPDGAGDGRCGIERLGLDHTGPAVARFLLDRRGLHDPRADRPVLSHLPGF